MVLLKLKNSGGETWLVTTAGCTRLLDMRQMYIKITEIDQRVMVAVKLTDKILLAGRIPDLQQFAKDISAKYKVRKIITDDDFNFNGCNITQNSRGNIRMDMTEFIAKLKLIQFNKAQIKEPNAQALKTEIYLFRALAGYLLWLGSAVISQDSCVSSFMQ